MTHDVLSYLSQGCTASGPDGYAAIPDKWGDLYPTIWEVLARSEYEGAPRKLGRISIWVEAGRATVCLTDRHSAQVCFFADLSITMALEGLEAALASGRADWRRDAGRGRSNRA